MNKLEISEITEADVTKALNDPKQEFAYTPTEKEVREAVAEFLEHNTGWVQNGITKDAALNTKSKDEALSELMKYQGLHALAFHQRAHKLYTEGIKEHDEGKLVEARNISQGVRRLTAGIEIHPGAKIGKNCFMDHATGTVIGETAEIGNDVFIYHGVTLGALDGTNGDKGADRGDGTKRRHPIIRDNVTIANGAQVLGPATIEKDVKIGAGAKIIGDITIGEGAIIAPGVEVRRNVAPKEIVVGAIPNLPGIISKNDAYIPITVPKNTVKVEGLQWYGPIVNALKQMLGLGGGQQSAAPAP